MKQVVKYKTIIKLLFSFIFLNCTVFLCAATVLDVGPGQTYSTTGTNDQVAINNAISAASNGDSVYLHAGTYKISAPIYIQNKNNIIIKGDGTSNTIVQASSYAAFLGTGYMSMIQITGTTNSELCGFTIKGVSPQVQPEDYDRESSNDNSENGISILSSSNNKIHDLDFTLISMDGIFSDECNGINIYNCVFNRPLHDCITCWDASNFHIYNCFMSIGSDSGVRFAYSKDSELSTCTMNVNSGLYGNGGVYFEHTISNIIVDKNIFRDMDSHIIGAIFVRTGETTTGTATVNDNVFYNCYRDIVPGALQITQNNNLYPTTTADWTAQGYGANIGNATSSTVVSATSSTRNYHRHRISGT